MSMKQTILDNPTKSNAELAKELGCAKSYVYTVRANAAKRQKRPKAKLKADLSVVEQIQTLERIGFERCREILDFVAKG